MRTLIALSLLLMLAVAHACGGTAASPSPLAGAAPATPAPTAPSCPSGQVIYSSANLDGHAVAAECNPGGSTHCACSDGDAAVRPQPGYGEVISNVNLRPTYVNAIGYRKFTETFPDGSRIGLCAYRYSGEFALPEMPRPDASQHTNAQSLHAMAQLWDGRSALFASGRQTVEGTLYWELNPWSDQFGKIRVYRYPVELVDTGLVVAPDTAWHTFELVVDFATQKYVRLAVDGRTVDLSNVKLARVAQPGWGSEVALSVTTESLASWPQAGCSLSFRWTTRFRNLRFEGL